MAHYLFLVFFLVHSVLAKHKPPDMPMQKWPTLTGGRPLVVARGGYSGVFPESSQNAYQIALSSMSDAVQCDLQLTKDGVGICQRDIRLDNSTTIANVYPKGKKTYDVNGKKVNGWFALDYTMEDIYNNVTLVQNILSRNPAFDEIYPLLTIDDVHGLKPSIIWLNVPYVMFYKLHNLDVVKYMEETLGLMRIAYISSPEIGFLKSISTITKDKTKLIFQFLKGDEIEPTTKQEYSAILKNLVSIKSFASGILVPKEFIWPVNANLYLEPHTSLVADAHKLGLEVYASGFGNDMPASYNYSYDPVVEYLHFTGSSDFAVDGVLTDFPSTALEALSCFPQNKTTKPGEGPLIISHNGASGVRAASSDLAYQQAVDDGADVIDCSVQMSKDGVAFCLPSADLTGDTTAQTTFMSLAVSIPEIQPDNGIFSFDLTANEIQSLNMVLVSPKETLGMVRNPEYKNKGKIITLSEFLDFAKAKAVSGILIDIENAPYLASKKGLSITDAVFKALANATLDKQITQQVYIQSDDTSVLSTFKNITGYKKILKIKELISSVPEESVVEIKKFADAVNLRRPSIITTDSSFMTTGKTDVINRMQSANISVYVSVLRNEYTVIPFDFLADPYVEIASYVKGDGITADGIITDFPFHD